MCMNSHETGKEGENLVLDDYLGRGYSLVERNFQYYQRGGSGRRGEIDLIFQKDSILVLVEVKARSNSSFGSGLEQVTRGQLFRLFKSYQYFISKNNQFANYNCRFDVASVMNGQVQVIKNAYDFDGLA